MGKARKTKEGLVPHRDTESRSQPCLGTGHTVWSLSAGKRGPKADPVGGRGVGREGRRGDWRAGQPSSDGHCEYRAKDILPSQFAPQWCEEEENKEENSFIIE